MFYLYIYSINKGSAFIYETSTKERCGISSD